MHFKAQIPSEYLILRHFYIGKAYFIPSFSIRAIDIYTRGSS